MTLLGHIKVSMTWTSQLAYFYVYSNVKKLMAGHHDLFIAFCLYHILFFPRRIFSCFLIQLTSTHLFIFTETLPDSPVLDKNSFFYGSKTLVHISMYSVEYLSCDYQRIQLNMVHSIGFIISHKMIGKMLLQIWLVA